MKLDFEAIFEIKERVCIVLRDCVDVSLQVYSNEESVLHTGIAVPDAFSHNVRHCPANVKYHIRVFT